MNGKPTFQKAMQRANRAQYLGAHKSKAYLEVGSWKFEENEDGDLVVSNIETEKSVIISRR